MERSDLVDAAHLVKAARAIDRVAIAGDEWDRCLGPAFRANDLSLCSLLQSHLRLSARSAVRATSWDIRQPFLLVKLLLARGPRELLITLPTRQRAV